MPLLSSSPYRPHQTPSQFTVHKAFHMQRMSDKLGQIPRFPDMKLGGKVVTSIAACDSTPIGNQRRASSSLHPIRPIYLLSAGDRSLAGC